jgi:hypothetical protein
MGRSGGLAVILWGTLRVQVGHWFKDGCGAQANMMEAFRAAIPVREAAASHGKRNTAAGSDVDI